MDLWLGVVWWDYCDASIPLATDRVLNTLGGVLQSIVTVTSDACRHTWRQIHDVNEFHEMCVICSSSSGMPTAVEILGQAMVTDLPSSFSSSVKALSGFDMAKRAAEQAMALARVTVHWQDVDVVDSRLLRRQRAVHVRSTWTGAFRGRRAPHRQCQVGAEPVWRRSVPSRFPLGGQPQRRSREQRPPHRRNGSGPVR
mmetsp:Transcript_19783/g.42794  ORF Transcript_19783/g.42794 Transcript_19783/m.42794 type:complete len:198 (+) Transcript_19783:246-839(+)